MNLREFVKVYNDTTEYPTTGSVADFFGCHPRTVQKNARRLRAKGVYLVDRSVPNRDDTSDEELIKESVRLAKSLQKERDKSTAERKAFREHARIENAVSELNDALVDLLRKQSIHIHTQSHPTTEKAVGIVHWSDLHFNEQIDLPHNKFNFEIASKRIRKHVSRAKHYFKGLGISEVVVCLTGDSQNSDRRIGELMTNAHNRSKALFLAVDIIQQAIQDLNEDFNLTVVSVVGNESRVGKDIEWERCLATDSFDYALHRILSLLFTDREGVTFLDCDKDPLEKVINVLGSNILLIHGHNGLAANLQKRIPIKRAQYSARGIHLDYIICGHLHQAEISDYYARSSGLPGANAYSENALDLSSRASQNLYIFYGDKSHDCIKIDLQNVDGTEGYPFNKGLESYHSKSESKIKNHTVIHQVIV